MKSAMTLTIATYNICHGRYADFDWERIAEPIRAIDPDVVGVQEMDMFTRRSKGIDTLHAMSAATGLPHALFVPTMDYDAGQYGTAILSRYPIEVTAIFGLPGDGLEPRAAGCVRLNPDGEHEFWFVNTHLSHKSARARHEQLKALRETLREIIPAGTPTLITGDFNTEERLTPAIGEHYGDINESRQYLTFQDPPLSIDRILYTPADLSPISHGMVESNASDHNLLWSKFTWLQ